MPGPREREEFRGYAVQRASWEIAGRSFDLTWPADVDALLDLPITQERFDRDEYMPYWAQPWPAAVLLAEAVLRGEPGAGRPAVEIGGGVGLVSLAAAAMGWSVVASDYDEDAIAFAELNARNNDIALAAYELIDYREPLPGPRYDFILGADLLYERVKGEPVASWISSALRVSGKALLSDPNRSIADNFPDHARAAGLKIDVRSVQTTAPDGKSTRGRIWRLAR